MNIMLRGIGAKFNRGRFAICENRLLQPGATALTATIARFGLPVSRQRFSTNAYIRDMPRRVTRD